MPKASMTYHAWQRLCERCVYSIEQLCHIVNEDRVVPIGQETGTNRMHKLFYSPDDEMYFVVVQDIKTGEIVTVIPADYHNRWHISDEALRMAKDIMSGKPAPVIEPVLPAIPEVLKFLVYTRGFEAGDVKGREFKVRDKAAICELLRLNRPEVDGKSRTEAFMRHFNGCVSKDKRQGYSVESAYYRVGNDSQQVQYLLD